MVCNLQVLCNDINCDKCMDRSFASHDKAKYWSKKNDCDPRDVFKSSNKKYKFDCKCGHEIEISLDKISNNNQWCGYCSNPPKKLCNDINCEQCMEKSFASHPKAKYLSKKNEVSPREIFKSTNKKYIFDCKCGHEYEISPNKIKNSCCYCSNQKLCDDINCDNCMEKSFAMHPNAKYWSQDNECDPRDIFLKSSNKKYKFDCIKCGHTFESRLADMSISKQSCPYCERKKLCGGINCIECFEKSFASHKKSKYWSNKNKCKPINVFKSSNTKYKFDCKCGHTFEITPNRITNSNYWCSYCSNPPQKLCDDIDCDQCMEKSFASHPKAQYWLFEENNCDPRDVFKSTHKQYKFICPDCKKIYETKLSNVTNRNSWCPCKKNKSETKLYQWLKNNKFDITFPAKYTWCKNKKLLPFDFAIEEFKLIIELDGPQHFKQTSNWLDPKIVQQTDIYKMECALKNGYTIIRLLQKDVWENKNNWQKKLTKHLYLHQEPTYIFIDNNNEYDCYRKHFD